MERSRVYFTAWSKGAGVAAEIAKGDGKPRVYIVEPTGAYENDPNVLPLRIVGELESWEP